jgi:hypothetical protein
VKVKVKKVVVEEEVHHQRIRKDSSTDQTEGCIENL